MRAIHKSKKLADVCYDIRGPVLEKARQMEEEGHKIIKLNIGNLAVFGFDAPDEIVQDMIRNMSNASGYTDSKGMFAPRKAIMHYAQEKKIDGVTIDDIYLGNGASELIVMSMNALLNNGDEVLVPAPDYPLWTAAVNLNRGRAIHYPCRPENGFVPDPAEIESLVTPRTRAIVIVNPNNPTGAVYPRSVLAAIARLAEQRGLVVMSDEIYDQVLYDDAEFVPMATLVHDAVCVTMSGLSKVYRACGYRVGWAVISGRLRAAQDFLEALELLASLRLCSNVPGQWAVQTALGGHQSIRELTSPGGRLYESRRAIVEAARANPLLKVHEPQGALYAFVGVDSDRLPGFDDQAFALELLERKHVLVAPGVSFNVPYRDHFRVTNLPDAATLAAVFARMGELLGELAERSSHSGRAIGLEDS